MLTDRKQRFARVDGRFDLRCFFFYIHVWFKQMS